MKIKLAHRRLSLSKVATSFKEHLPSGPFQASDTLDAAFKEGRWWARAYLDPQSNKLALVATGT